MARGSADPSLIDAAVQSLLAAARHGPHDATVYWQLGDAFAARGERQRAVQNFATAMRLQPTSVEASLLEPREGRFLRGTVPARAPARCVGLRLRTGSRAKSS